MKIKKGCVASYRYSEGELLFDLLQGLVPLEEMLDKAARIRVEAAMATVREFEGALKLYNPPPLKAGQEETK